MDDKDFSKGTISKSRYQTLIGFGILFKRARKLCGTRNGKEYPSIIGDSSVGMATTIYAMTYLHYITKGCIDYWAIYNYKYDVADSMLNSKRVFTELDDIIEHVIVKCWKKIELFGGTSAQERTKKKEFWEKVKSNVRLDSTILSEMNSFLISEDERDKRETEIES